MSAGTAAAPVTVERVDAVAVVRIANPPLNLLTQAVRQALGEAFAALGRDDGVHVAVFGAGERHFCAGADMQEFPLRFDPAVAGAHWDNAYAMTRNLLRCPVPVVAGLRGACLGGGMELALACDFRVAAADSRLGLPEVHRGIYPGSGGPLLLARLLGDAAAKRIVMDGAVLSGEEALREGLADRLADGDAEDAALAWARELAERPAGSLRTIKRLVDADFLARFEARAPAEREAFVACYRTADAREGNAAFFEKRQPHWHHE